MSLKSLFPFSVKNGGLAALGLAGLGQFFLAQQDKPWTLFPGLALYAAALLLFTRPSLPAPPVSLNPRIERMLLGSILLLGLCLRLFHTDSLPPGMHTDQGFMGQSAQRIAFEGWRPFREIFDDEVPQVLLLYQMAAWFRLAGSSPWAFHLFFALLSLAAFLLIYWTFRQWAGPRAALVSLFLLAVMRWDWVMTRTGYPSIQVSFYLFGALAFWVYWRKSRKAWAWVISAFFTGAGFYTYQAFKIVPLLMAFFGLDEYTHDRKKSLGPFLPYFLLVLVWMAPLLGMMAQKGSLGLRESQLFLGSKILEEKSLRPLLTVWSGDALMFNRRGDSNARHNIPGHRMLDDVTGVFFILGLGLACRRRRDPGFFYPLVGFAGMALTGLLADDPANANRLVSLTPFAAFFAGTAMEFSWVSLGPAFKVRWGLALAVLLLGGLAAQNGYTYFVTQNQEETCHRGFGLEQNFIGRTIERLEKSDPGRWDYFITPAYYGNHTIAFLGYPAGGRVRPLRIPEDLIPGQWPKDKDTLFVLETGKSGLEELLEELFPGGRPERLLDPKDGHPLLFLYWVPKEILGLYQGWNRGLQGTYVNSSDPKAKPVAVRWDPLLNFTYKGDFPFQDYPPFFIRWMGDLSIPKSGEYQFQVLTSDKAQLWLDGKRVALEMPLKMARGAHSLKLEFEKKDGDSLVLHLIWKKSGDTHWEIIPATAFGKIKAGG